MRITSTFIVNASEFKFSISPMVLYLLQSINQSLFQQVTSVSLKTELVKKNVTYVHNIKLYIDNQIREIKLKD